MYFRFPNISMITNIRMRNIKRIVIKNIIMNLLKL